MLRRPSIFTSVASLSLYLKSSVSSDWTVTENLPSLSVNLSSESGISRVISSELPALMNIFLNAFSSLTGMTMLLTASRT